jgi:tetratricopeptide (TPR) repeat protein
LRPSNTANYLRIVEAGNKSGTETLSAAVQAFREALKEYTRERAPLDWAGTQNNLGNALLRFGERESGTETLSAAVQAFREALKEYTRERAPLQWAMTQNNLGNALLRFGKRESGTETLTAAVQAFREALKEYTHERVPLQWAMAQNNLGNALWRLGERRADLNYAEGCAILSEAHAAYAAALREFARAGADHYKSMARNNLRRLAEIEGRVGCGG